MSDAENTTREKLIGHISAALDQSACYDDDGELKLTRHLDVEPYEVPDLTDDGAAAFIADALIAAFPTLTSADGAIPPHALTLADPLCAICGLSIGEHEEGK